MARGKKTKNSNQEWYDNSINEVMLSGIVKKIILETEKCIVFKVETVTRTPKGNWAHQWILVESFDEDLELVEGDFITLNGYIHNNNYEDKNGNKVYSYEVIANTCTVGECPFSK